MGVGVVGGWLGVSGRRREEGGGGRVFWVGGLWEGDRRDRREGREEERGERREGGMFPLPFDHLLTPLSPTPQLFFVTPPRLQNIINDTQTP